MLPYPLDRPTLLLRNFTNDAVFDDTLPVVMDWWKTGNRGPYDASSPAMEDWFRRKGYPQGRGTSRGPLKSPVQIHVANSDLSCHGGCLLRHASKVQAQPQARL